AAPPLAVTVDGTNATGSDFLDTQIGQISGRVFDDTTGDGTKLLGKPGQAGVTVFVDLNGNGRPDPGEPSMGTGPAGVYAFDGLPPGTYDVTVVPGADRRPTTPGGLVQRVTVGGGRPATGIDFGSTVGINATWSIPQGAVGDWTLRRNRDRLELVNSLQGVVR